MTTITRDLSDLDHRYSIVCLYCGTVSYSYMYNPLIFTIPIKQTFLDCGTKTEHVGFSSVICEIYQTVILDDDWLINCGYNFPLYYRWRKLLYGVEALHIPDKSELTDEDKHLCDRFVKYHQQLCEQKIVRDMK